MSQVAERLWNRPIYSILTREGAKLPAITDHWLFKCKSCIYNGQLSHLLQPAASLGLYTLYKCHGSHYWTVSKSSWHAISLVDTQDQACAAFQQELVLLLVCCSPVTTSTYFIMMELVDTSRHLPHLNLFIKVWHIIPFSCQMRPHVNFQSITNIHIAVCISYVEASIHETKLD